MNKVSVSLCLSLLLTSGCGILQSGDEANGSLESIVGSYWLDVDGEQHAYQEDWSHGELRLSLSIECSSGGCEAWVAEQWQNPWHFVVCDRDEKVVLIPKSEPVLDGEIPSGDLIEHTFHEIAVERLADGSLGSSARISVDDYHLYGDMIVSKTSDWAALVSPVSADPQLKAWSVSGENLPWENVFVATERPVDELEQELMLTNLNGVGYSTEVEQQPASVVEVSWNDAVDVAGQSIEISLEAGAQTPGGGELENSAAVTYQVADLGPAVSELDMSRLPPVVSGGVTHSTDESVCGSSGCLVMTPDFPYCDEGGHWYFGASWVAFWLDTRGATELRITTTTNSNSANEIELIDMDRVRVVRTEELGQREDENMVELTQTFPLKDVETLGVRILNRANCYDYSSYDVALDAAIQRVWVE